jgi:DNA replication protein DnaC
MVEAVCPICDGTGWKIVERSGLSGAARCSCAEVARSRALKEDSRIPPNYQHASLENFKIPQDNPIARDGLTRALLAVKAFVRGFPVGEPQGLLLVGDTGVGKTHLAVAALKSLIEKGHEGLFYDYQNLLERIRSSYDRAAGAGDREAYGTAMECEVLLLDDLGSHRVTEWVEDTVTSIITHRCNNRKALIATTNLNPDDVGTVAYTTSGGTDVHKKTLIEAIGARARSRLFEMCRVVRIPAVEDYRVAKGRK